jgi:hypothetical protein
MLSYLYLISYVQKSSSHDTSQAAGETAVGQDKPIFVFPLLEKLPWPAVSGRSL